MEKVAAKFTSLDDAERAEWEFYRKLTPNERLEILLEILSLADDDESKASPGMARIYRIARVGEG
jgi:hypothetical protein